MISDTLFKKRLWHRYTRERGNQRSFLDYVVIKNFYAKRLLDVHIERGVVRGLFDYYLVKADGRIKRELKRRFIEVDG